MKTVKVMVTLLVLAAPLAAYAADAGTTNATTCKTATCFGCSVKNVESTSPYIIHG